MITASNAEVGFPRLRAPFPYIVCYDLKGSPLGYKPFVEELRNSVRWWHYLENTWIVFLYETLVELQRILAPRIYTQDRLLILPAHGPAEGYLPKEAWEWINEHLPRDW